MLLINASLCLFAFIVFITSVKTKNTDHYVAAVVEYYSTYNKGLTSLSNMLNNLNAYKKHIEEAKNEGADIVVFPEDGITSINLPNSQRETLPFTSIIPVRTNATDPNPCDNADVKNAVSTIVYELSCEAKKRSIYVVVNLAEKELNINNDSKWLLYNTDVVFNRKGDIIARYRKYNLFGEPMFNQTFKPELVTFETDFGATFGLFTCFDILFHNPAIDLVTKKNVTDVIFPTAWFSELPFLTAIQTQAGWALANKINLLAAGYSNIADKNGGSGIYIPTSDTMVTYIPENVSTQIITATVPLIKNENACNYINYKYPRSMVDMKHVNVPKMRTQVENLSKYSTELLTQNVQKHKIHHDDSFWCEFTVNYMKSSKISDGSIQYYYRMVAYNGIRYMGIKKRYTQVCGLVACSDSKKSSSCGYIDYKAENLPYFPTFFDIEIKGNFKVHGDIVIFPSTVNYNLYSLPYDDYVFNKNGSSIILLTKQEQLMAFGIVSEIW